MERKVDPRFLAGNIILKESITEIAIFTISMSVPNKNVKKNLRKLIINILYTRKL